MIAVKDLTKTSKKIKNYFRDFLF